MNDIEWGDDRILSTDIINRVDELQDELDQLVDNVDNVDKDEDPDGYAWAQSELAMFNTEYLDELNTLKEACEQGSMCSGWWQGVWLINDEVFEDYARGVIDESIDSKLFDGWPNRYLSMDYEQAANDMKADYSVIEVGSYTYYVV